MEEMAYVADALSGAPREVAGSEQRGADETTGTPLSPHDIGVRGETAAVLSLMRRGWEIVCRNWRCELGEIDIIARDPEGKLVLVEVKTRMALGSRWDVATEVAPELAVDEAKREKYERLASIYLRYHPEIEEVRFDVIAITVTSSDGAHLRQIYHVAHERGSGHGPDRRAPRRRDDGGYR